MKNILVVGGCGFIGTNACEYYLRKGFKVIAFDNLSRVGAKQNLEWLKEQGENFVFIKGDITIPKQIRDTIKEYKPDYILHLAAQVTMVDSLTNPRYDFKVNAEGTFNVLEAIRLESPQSIILYTSTNKVYGEMKDIKVSERAKRYEYAQGRGISEKRPLDFHGPYGCSKGTGDAYCLDYARVFNLNTIVFRQSGIYGPHQFGIEEQGWLAWFCNALIFNKPVKIFGNGKQVRDVLYVTDVLDAYNLAFENIEITKGQVYNIGGGQNFSLSIWQLFNILERLVGNKFEYTFEDWREGDQKIYISDIDKAKEDFNWKPVVAPNEGVQKMHNWIECNKDLLIKAKVFK